MGLLGFCEAASLAREWQYWMGPGPSGRASHGRSTPAAPPAAPSDPRSGIPRGTNPGRCPDAKAPASPVPPQPDSAPATANPASNGASDKERQVEA